MKTKGYQFQVESPFYVYLKKHDCPICRNRLSRQKVSKVIHSDSAEAQKHDFEVSDIAVKGKMRFSHIEFYCAVCKKNYTVKEIKQIDHKARRHK